jgi:rubrerythrin
MDPTPSSAPGALRELAADPFSRKRFLRMAGGGAVAASLSAAIAACGEDEELGNQFGGAGVGTEPYGQGDAGIVAYALFLERLEVAFYEGAVESGRLRGPALVLAQRFGAEEEAHVRSLEGTLEQLGGEEPQLPEFSFGYGTQQQVLTTAAEIEGVGADAYLGQLRRIQSKQVLSVALSIHTVEGRHAAALAQILGNPIAPDGAFAHPASSSEVLARVRPFLSV